MQSGELLRVFLDLDADGAIHGAGSGGRLDRLGR